MNSILKITSRRILPLLFLLCFGLASCATTGIDEQQSGNAKHAAPSQNIPAGSEAETDSKTGVLNNKSVAAEKANELQTEDETKTALKQARRNEVQQVFENIEESIVEDRKVQ